MSDMSDKTNQSYKSDEGAHWHALVSSMKSKAAAVDWSGVDWSKLKASDVGVHIGAPMTEEQFLEYKKRQGQSVHVIKPGDTKPKKT